MKYPPLSNGSSIDSAASPVIADSPRKCGESSTSWRRRAEPTPVCGDHHIAIHMTAAGENDPIAGIHRLVTEGLKSVPHYCGDQRVNQYRLPMVALHTACLARAVAS
jgi:hypothetical protein